jgi:hypothetical protein
VTAPAWQKIRCPLPSCIWEIEFEPAEVPDSALAAVFGPGVMTSIARTQDIQRLEDQLREHFEKHSLPEFVQALREQSQDIERLKARAEKFRRQLNPQPGDFVKGWIDEGGSAQGILLTPEEATAAMEAVVLPTYYAAVKTQPAGNVVTVMRESLRGVEK